MKLQHWLLAYASATALAACLYLFYSGDISRVAPVAADTFMRELIARQDYCARWYKPAAGTKTTGAALVVHGLNVRPEMMAPVIDILNSAGIEALNVSLCGHGDNFLRRSSYPADEKRDRLESFKRVSHFLWLNEIHQAYLKVMLSARKLDAPIFFVGFSLGGLLGCDLLAAQPGVHFDRMVLFAPAITLRPAIGFQLKPLLPFPEFVIDSDAPEDQRANDGTPVAGYAALLDAIAAVEMHAGQKLNVPTLVFMDKEDEFVSFEQLQEFIQKTTLDRWELAAVTKDNETDAAVARHMIINEHSVGASRWKKISRLIIGHLLQSSAGLKASPKVPRQPDDP